MDWGMALARGYIPNQEAAQKDLLAQLNYDKSIFKSEDWWNKALDKQISSGYRKESGSSQYYLMPSGEYQKGTTSTSYYKSSPFGLQTWSGGSGIFAQSAPSYSPIFGYSGGWSASTSWHAPEGAVFTTDPKTGEKKYTIESRPEFGSETKYFTSGELSAITATSKEQTSKLKREAETAKSKASRKARGTGGLTAKAILPGTEASASGLPILGETGLNAQSTILGKGLFK